MMIGHAARWAVVVFAMALSGQPRAATQTAVVGGPGGAAFADQPPAQDARVVAVMIAAGSWVDAVQMLYLTPDARRLPSARHGGPGGRPHVFALEPDEYIVGISGGYGEYVGSIQIHTNKRASPVYGGPGGRPYRITVPAGHTVVGFVGRSGQYVDAIGYALNARQPSVATPPGQPSSLAAPPVQPSPPAPKPAALSGPVRVRSNLQPDGRYSDAALSFTLTAPAQVEVTLGDHNPGTRSCFPASYRALARWTARQPDTRHAATFRNLQMATPYYYAIRIGSACESGSFTTATKID